MAKISLTINGKPVTTEVEDRTLLVDLYGVAVAGATGILPETV